jgi:NDP-sugar pyrophosphorylase family protein
MCDHALIRYPLALLAQAGIRRAAVNLHHLGEALVAELGDQAQGVSLTYFRETTLLGTGGGLRNARAFLGEEGPFVVVNGKVVIDLDLEAVVRAHRESGARATLVVRHVPDARRWGAITVEGGRVVGILDRRAPDAGSTGGVDTMFTGVSILDPALLDRLPPGESCIIRQGLIPALHDGASIGAYVADGYFAEHSTPARYLAGNLDLLAGAKLAVTPGALQGVDPAADVHPSAALLAPIRIAAGATVEAGARVGPGVVVGHGARVGRDVVVRESVLWPGGHLDHAAERVIVTSGGAQPVS